GGRARGGGRRRARGVARAAVVSLRGGADGSADDRGRGAALHCRDAGRVLGAVEARGDGGSDRGAPRRIGRAPTSIRPASRSPMGPLVACWAPSRRAATVDPIEALRAE